MARRGHRASLAIALGATSSVGMALAPGTALAPLAAPPDQPSHVASYVALGDSFTSGPGIPLPEAPYGCHRSTNNYPHLLASALNYSFVGDFSLSGPAAEAEARLDEPKLQLRDASCAGAKTVHMTRQQKVLLGPNPPQLDSLNVATRLVTLQLGGNDIGYSEIIDQCSSSHPTGTPCRNYYVNEAGDELSKRIAATAPRIADTIRGAPGMPGIRDRAPHAEVLVLGYPVILPDEGPGCWPVMPFTPGDVHYLREKHWELNAMLKTVATSEGVRYVDVYTGSVGHDACQPPGQRWVEPAVPASPATPYHPNLSGMKGVAQILLTELSPR